MKVELSEPSAVKRVMAIEVDAAELARETEVVLRGYARQARLPGFRQGKVPLGLVRARFGKEVESEVRERVMTRCFREATRERGLEPLGDPALDDVGPPDGGGLRFRVTFEVLPSVELRGHRGVTVERPAVAVTADDVERVLEELRQSQAKLVGRPGRVAEPGDVLLCDVRGAPERGAEFVRENALVEVGAAHNPPAFNERLLGATAGTELAFGVDHPERQEPRALAGRHVDYTVRVHEVKMREVPPLDDEFAKDVGEFADLAALRARLRHDLEQRQEREADRSVRQRVLDEVLLANPIVLPDTLVDDEVRSRLEQLVRGLVLQGIDPRKIELDWQQLRDEQLEPARKTVHARLILDAVARVEGLAVTEGEVAERVKSEAEALGEKPEALRKQLEKRGGLAALRAQLLREKALDLMTSVANIHGEV